MNAFYVTVSIPLLLILVGFNHAHGLTTFGKSTNTNTNPPQNNVQGKPCNTQANCNLIKGTTCLKGYCLCGDNAHPVNGICKATHKGPKHLCTTDEECVTGAECLPPKDKNKTAEGIDKVCTCQEGLYEVPGGMCGGSSNFVVLPGLLLIIAFLSRTLN